METLATDLINKSLRLRGLDFQVYQAWKVKHLFYFTRLREDGLLEAYRACKDEIEPIVHVQKSCGWILGGACPRWDYLEEEEWTLVGEAVINPTITFLVENYQRVEMINLGFSEIIELNSPNISREEFNRLREISEVVIR